MSIKKVSRMAAVAAMVLFSCGVDAQWSYDSSGDEPTVTYGNTGNPSKYYVVLPVPTDTSKSVDLLLQWTWPASIDSTVSESVVCTFPSAGGTYDPTGYYVQTVQSGLIDSEGLYVSTKPVAWGAGTPATDDEYFLSDPINGPGGSNFNLATYAVVTYATISGGGTMYLDIFLARDEPENPNIIFSLGYFEYDESIGEEAAWKPEAPLQKDFIQYYGYDKSYAQILFYVAGGLNIIPVASLPLMQVPMLLLLAHFAVTPVYMLIQEPENVLFAQNEYFTTTILRNIGGTLFLYVSFTLNWALMLIPFMTSVAMILQSSILYQFITQLFGTQQIIPIVVLIMAELFIISVIQEVVNVVLIGLGYGLFTYLETPV